MSGFRNTDGRGFHITFKNGYTVSVQFGAGNYCENYDMSFKAKPRTLESGDAEVAVFNEGNKDLIALEEFDGNTVGSNYTPEMVLKLLNWAESQA